MAVLQSSIASGAALLRRSPARHRLVKAALIAGATLAVIGGGLKEAWLAPTRGEATSRREALTAGLTGFGLLVNGLPADASGPTAGKYSTIPTGKRRYYGRVRQGLYQYLQMETAIMKGDFKDPTLDAFFGKNIIKVKGDQSLKNCAFAPAEYCTTKEKRTSRWLDFKVASDLLATAFRYDASDVDSRLPQVKIIRSYAKKVEKMRDAIDANDIEEVKTIYAQTKVDLSRYVKMVELAPLDSEDYTHEWDTRPKATCSGNYCL